MNTKTIIIMKYITIIIAVVLLKSCGSSKDLATNTNDMITNNILTGTYTLDSDTISKPLTLEFDETTNKVSGFSGCNRFFGTYKTDGNSITFSQMASTKMMCQEEANNTEQKFLNALSRVNTFSIEDTNLSLQADKETLITANQVDSSKMMQASDVKVTYQAVSRGFSLTIMLEGDSISFSNDRDLKSLKTHAIPKEEKDTLLELINAMDESTLPGLEAPSKAHQYDGAAIATLEVANGEDSYRTVSFDHGNPPESIKAIVEKMLSIKTIIEKQ